MSKPFFVFLLISLISNVNAFTLKMIPIDSPHLQIVPSNLSSNERHQILVNISMARTLNYKDDLNAYTDSIQSNSFKVPNGYYVTQLFFGSNVARSGRGPYSPYLVLDTGSDETWVQCEGCNPCFQVKDNDNFRYRRSSTFRLMTLYDSLCVPRVEYAGSCGYSIQYIESRTSGILGRDDFYFKESETGNINVYQNLAFGCGLQNENIKFWDTPGPNNVIAGVHGLAMGPRSFITQLGHLTNGRFSYCLTSLSNTPQSTIYFGPHAQISGDATRQVKMISMYSLARYHLYLAGISVDGNRVPIDPSIFMLDEARRTKGFFVDSGSPYSYLPRSAYDPIKAAMVRYFGNRYGWRGTRFQKFDLCYSSYPEDDQDGFPSMTLHFQLLGHSGEVDMELSADNVFMPFSNKRKFCLAIMRGDDPGPSILGAFQQKNFKFLFDIYNGHLYFVPQICAGN